MTVAIARSLIHRSTFINPDPLLKEEKGLLQFTSSYPSGGYTVDFADQFQSIRLIVHFPHDTGTPSTLVGVWTFTPDVSTVATLRLYTSQVTLQAGQQILPVTTAEVAVGTNLTAYSLKYQVWGQGR